jgi:aminomethyltransferase
MSELLHTPLHRLHAEHGARFAPFAGYDMPLRYEAGAVAEHRWTRASAGLFDVSHMGVLEVVGADAAAALESVVPSDLRGLAPGTSQYTVLTNDAGGVIDDLIVTRLSDDEFQLVVNAATKAGDRAHLGERIGDRVRIDGFLDVGIIALQGPQAVDVLSGRDARVGALVFGEQVNLEIAGVCCRVSRSGYTGEDGFELIVPTERIVDVAEALLGDERVAPAGLGARDSLRLEAGLCLYGSDLDETTSPVEAGLRWVVQARRREEGGFPGAERVLGELADGPARRRVGLAVAGRRPVRPGSTIHDPDGTEVGNVTSGTFGPTVDHPIAMGYVRSGHHDPGTELVARQRGRDEAVTVARLPFVPHRYVR